MHLLSPDDRPREKLHQHGASALGDNELLALVLGTGSGGSGALDLANALLKACGGVHGLVRARQSQLARVSGIGPARAAQIAAAVELGRRTLVRPPGLRTPIRAPRDAADLLMPVYGGRATELFGILLLDSKHRMLKTSVVSEGTLNRTIVEPRDVFREALFGSAAAVVLFHTHPSGDPAPSEDDDRLTRRLVAAGVLMGVQVVDHIVLGDVCYFSFKENGRL
jgi:DNA repair protein RadC